MLKSFALRCNRRKSAGQTRSNSGYILPCKHLICLPCYDSCIAPAGGRHLNTFHAGTCPVRFCGVRFTSFVSRKWTPSDLNERHLCGSDIGESAPGEVGLTGASGPVEHVRSDSPEPVPEADNASEDKGEEEVAEGSQQSTSLFTTSSDADHAERLALIREDADAQDNETIADLTEVESTWSEPGSGYTTPRNQTTFLDLTHSSPLIISSQSAPSVKSTPSVKSGTRTRRSKSDSITVSPSKSRSPRTKSSENLEPVPPSPKFVLETIKSKKLKRSRSQLSDVSNGARPAPKNRPLRQESWSSDHHTPPSSQGKDEAFDALYGREAKAQAPLERGDSEDDEEYSVHSSSQPESVSDEPR